MATIVKIISLVLLFLYISECGKFDHNLGKVTPSGVCFVPTKLSEAAEPLSNPLISPSTPGYQDIYNEFIAPMLNAISLDLNIFGTESSSRTEQKEIKSKLRSQSDNVEVYYIDHFNDRLVFCLYISYKINQSTQLNFNYNITTYDSQSEFE